jgi:hypothetical protein
MFRQKRPVPNKPGHWIWNVDGQGTLQDAVIAKSISPPMTAADEQKAAAARSGGEFRAAASAKVDDEILF